MADSEEFVPILSAMREAMGMNQEQVKKVFASIAVFTHVYASILANNSLAYDEELVISHLDRSHRGAVLALQEENE